MMRFESPWALLLLALLPVLFFLRRRFSGRSTLMFPTIVNAEKSGRSMRQGLSGLPLLIRVLALILLILAIARPQKGMEKIREITQGIAIEMVVDRSGSMAQEMAYRGGRMNRLDVVKQVFKEFALGNGKDLSGRPDDLMGVIAFARYPDTVCPLTLAHGAFPAFLKSIRLVKTKSEDGTAIGDALALAAARLKKADETLEKQRKESTRTYQIKSRIIILLSDGENNFGNRSPIEAAELAAQWGIKVYTIAIGGSETATSIKTPFGTYKMPLGSRVDTTTLKAVAERTGGFFRKAEDADSLREIYAEIDKMEKTDIESVRFMDFKETFLWFVMAGFFLIVLEITLNATVFRKIP